jgi:hypothetical protein
MPGGDGNPPPNKWGKVAIEDASSDDVLAVLNGAANQVTAAFVMECTDGRWLFEGNYSEK